MKTFSDKVRDIVRKIPKGKTLTYKAVAAKSRQSESCTRGWCHNAHELRPIDPVSSRYCKRRLNARLRSSAPSAGEFYRVPPISSKPAAVQRSRLLGSEMNLIKARAASGAAL